MSQEWDEDLTGSEWMEVVEAFNAAAVIPSMEFTGSQWIEPDFTQELTACQWAEMDAIFSALSTAPPGGPSAQDSLGEASQSRKRAAPSSPQGPRRKRLRLQVGSGAAGPEVKFDWMVVRDFPPEHSPRFRRTQYRSLYRIDHNMGAFTDLLAVDSAIDSLFETLVMQKASVASDNDVLSITINHKDLTEPIFIQSRKSNLNREDFLNSVYEVAQSNGAFLMDGVLDLEVVIIKTPSGGTR
jgi:hypothetical protein